MSFLKAYKKRFDKELDRFIATKEAAAAYLVRETELLPIIRHSLALVREGGKRLRPYLINLSYRMAGGQNTQATLPAELAMELFHTFCLIHDDILDQGRERHGLPTIDRFTDRFLRDKKRIGHLAGVATGQAILAGDLLASWANQTFHQLEGMTETTRTEAELAFFQMQSEVILGQMIDIDLTTQREASRAMIDRKNWLKTASYSVCGPMRIGTALAGGTVDTWDNFISNFGGALGLAFQIQDDVNEIVVEENYQDITGRQPTYLTEHIRRGGSPTAKKTLARWFGRPVTAAGAKALSCLLTESGAITAALTAVSTHRQRAGQLLAKLRLPAALTAEWQEILDHPWFRLPNK